MYQAHPPQPPQETLPTMYDLPSENLEDPGLDEFHRLQSELLSKTCFPLNYPPHEVFVASDLHLYYDVKHTLWYKRPDWFLVLGVPTSAQQQALRWSYVVWQEGVNPFLVVELLSPGTEDEDLGKTVRQLNKPPTKWEVYERILRIPYYVLYDRYTNRLRGYQLLGSRYQEMLLPNQRFWLDELGLGLGCWEGAYEGVYGLWLRWYNDAGEWIPTPEERAEQLATQLAQEQQKRQALLERLSMLSPQQLQDLGIDPKSLI